MLVRSARSLALALATACALLLAALPASAQVRIAVVHTQRAVADTEDGLRAQATLKKLFDTKQRELDAAQADLQREREEIEKQRGVLSQEAFQKRVDKWQQDMMELQARFVDYQRELQEKQNQLMAPIFEKTMQIIERLARQDGYDMVLDMQVVPYVRSDLDLTDRIIMIYNRGGDVSAVPAASAAPPAAPKPPTP